ncbi:hypothetical protein [Holdemanella biformis]|uniref:hypothetical protein n=1 Tax=Holdemanella biformis TaxID=1735 RepID=UPI003A94AAD1
MKYKLAKILLALGIGLSLVSCAKKPEEPRSSQVKKEEKGNIGYTLSRKDPDRSIYVNICTDSSDTLEEAIVFHNEHLSKGEEPFTEYTLGEYSGYRSMSYTNYWNSANDTTYRYKLNYPVGDKNVILSCSVTLRDNSDDTTGLEDVMLATLQQLKVEIK